MPNADPTKPPRVNLIVDARNPLLIVTSMRDLKLEPDQLAVRVILNERDTKTFAQLTQQPRLVAFIGPPMKAGDSDTMVILTIPTPIKDGSLGFAISHHTGNMAAYLRQRFHIKPNSTKPKLPRRKLPHLRRPIFRPQPTHLATPKFQYSNSVDFRVPKFIWERTCPRNSIAPQPNFISETKPARPACPRPYAQPPAEECYSVYPVEPDDDLVPADVGAREPRSAK
jgi:hypothetical protein